MRRLPTYFLSVAGILGLLILCSVAIYQVLIYLQLDMPSPFVRVSMIVLLTFLALLILRYFALLWFSYLAQLDRGGRETRDDFTPLVTILVPCYNEGAVVQGSIRSLLKLDYPRYEILVIDDGSKDDTTKKARIFEGVHGGAEVRVIRKRNAGKAKALNTGIAAAKGEFVLCMDGDSALHPQTLRKAVRHLADPRVGAVAGSVKVVNRTNMLSTLQALEYIEGLNMVAGGPGILPARQHHPRPHRDLSQEARCSRWAATTTTPSPRTATSPSSCSIKRLAGEVRTGRHRLHRGAGSAARPAEATLSLDARHPPGDQASTRSA